MKYLKLLVILALCSMQLFAQNNYVHQVVVLNEGRFDYAQNMQVVPVTIGTIDPSTLIYTPFDTINYARFASHVTVDDQFIYAAADSFLIQYDKTTLQQTNSTVVPGIRKIALWNNQVIVSKGEYQKQFNSYIEVYDAGNFNLIYALDTIQGPAFTCEGIIITNNEAYVAVSNGFDWGNEKDIIGKIDLASQSYLSEINLGSNATNPENMMLANGKIYTINNQDYSTASISEYDIVSGTVNTTDLLTPTGCAASGMATNFVYYQVAGDNQVQRFNTSTLSTFDTLALNKSIYGMAYDDVNQIIYVGNTDYTSYGKIYTMNLTGIILDSVNVSVSPGNIALDVRIGSGISEAEEFISVQAYPNPTSDIISVELTNNISANFKYNVLDASGRGFSLDYAVENNRLILNTQKLSSAVYFLFIEDNNQNYKSVFVKQ
ncbi:MAG: T9SS type A sorting domain-containing protein [Bacteroidia bacterium]|nr:T9SS type A sorting domain-containing protein [Bacteroidia bacterium]